MTRFRLTAALLLIVCLVTGCPREPTSGSTSTSTSISTTATGSGAETGNPTETCTPSGSWCADLESLCNTAMLDDVSPNFCAGLAIICAEGAVSREQTCAGLVEQCEIGGAAVECAALAAECACLAEQN